jgi:hypothetical protein
MSQTTLERFQASVDAAVKASNEPTAYRPTPLTEAELSAVYGQSVAIAAAEEITVEELLDRSPQSNAQWDRWLRDLDHCRSILDADLEKQIERDIGIIGDAKAARELWMTSTVEFFRDLRYSFDGILRYMDATQAVLSRFNLELPPMVLEFKQSLMLQEGPSHLDEPKED